MLSKIKKLNKIRLVLTCLIFVFTITGLLSLLIGENIFVRGYKNMLRLAGIYTEPIKSVTINQDGYTSNTQGAWSINKSAKWIGKGKAEVVFDVKSNMKTNDDDKDIIIVMDISGSMYGSKLDRAKSDSKELVEEVLSNTNNKVSFITFDSTSEIVSNFTNDKTQLLSKIDSLIASGNTNYNAALQKSIEVLEGYQKESNKELVLLFLTDGYPCEDTHNEVSTYQVLKDKHPYITVQGIQYEMGANITDELKNISDNQFVADQTTLNNILFEASLSPYVYEKFEIIDYIEDEYFEVKALDDIKVPYGEVEIIEEGNGQKVKWNLDKKYKMGTTVQMKINLTMKQNYVGEEGFYPTNKKEEITSKLLNESQNTKTSNLTPVLSSHYKVYYDSNVPTGCSKQDLPSERHSVYEVVEKKNTKLVCSGYQFKGWEISTENVEKVNEDYFIMPEKDVTIKGIWTKHNVSKSMDGKIHIKKKVTNLYTDGTLIINDEDIDTNITKHGAIVKEYQGLDKNEPYNFTSDGYVLWYYEREQIKRVEIGEVIQPTSTAYWFYGTWYMEEGDFSNLDTSKVTNMGNMFYLAGYNATTFNLIGLNNWNTSKVTTMGSIFQGACQKATTCNIGNLSKWDVSSVTNMSNMFSWAAQYTTTWDIGDLSKWNVSSVTDMRDMFSVAGYSATTWDIGDLSSWNVSSVTNMSAMFYNAGYKATTFDISFIQNWDVSSVTNMSNMFYSAGQKATTWDIGNLSNWNTTNVTDMSRMFQNAGGSATTFDISFIQNWDVSSVKYMYHMFSSAGYSATTWNIGNLSNWNTSSVTNMSYMFSSAGYSATTWNSIGDLKVYATDTSNMFDNCSQAKATLTIYSNPTSYGYMFSFASTATGSSIRVNYSKNTTNIDAMIATKYNSEYTGGNVVKGTQID